MVVRTRRPFFRSPPGTFLWVSTALLIPLAFAIPYLPHAALVGFAPLPPGILAMVAGVTLLYVLAAELAKRLFHHDPAMRA